MNNPRLPAHALVEPLYERIRLALREDILGGALPPGSRVPSENALGLQYGVSRITVRQALAALQQEGLIFTRQGKGSFVSRPKAFQNVSTLQGFGEQMASRGYEVHNQLLGLAEVPAPAPVAARLGLSSGEPVSQIRRVRLLNREPVSIEWTWVRTTLGRQLAQADLLTRDIFLILENDCGVALGHADLCLDAVPADADTAQALRIAVGEPVLRIERLTHDAHGQPVDYEFLYFRGDTFQYRFRVDRHRPQE
ncbi:MAG TPA: GntR family transcriptional regulator [Aquabacterium sp.]|nr:GntR family transcriptional regulator [Aquabacterium sp.]